MCMRVCVCPCAVLAQDIDYFDRHGLLPAATNCGLSFNYTSSSVEATTTFRAVHSPLREKPDPLAAGMGQCGLCVWVYQQYGAGSR